MQARILDNGKLRVTDDLGDIRKAIAAKKLMWIDLGEPCDDADKLLADDLKLHPLTIEDIWLERQSPRIDDFDNYLYVLVHGVSSAGGPHKIKLVELDLVIGQYFLLTHDPADLVTSDLVAELERSPHLLEKGVAWLAYAALDHAVDRYLPVVDQLDGEIEKLEDDVIERAGTPRGRKVLIRILSFKRTLQELRRMGIHQREILLRLARGEFDEIPKDTIPFFRDVYDHFLRINDILEGYRDLVTSALDAYLSVQANRMNEIVKTLTLISTVMLPLTFIAGVYGMNFKHMPELDWELGYPFALAVMAAVAGGILLWFRHKGWMGRGAREELPTRKSKPKAKPKA